MSENKRTDLMGLLILAPPPGYGKTTLMEYVAHHLGLIFMKINGPALGHEARSFDPGQVPDATSRQELEKLNLVLEMGNNVMLYVNGTQHTHPEFLQKLISLCDGTYRMGGAWRGQTKTYDMRGRKLCVVTASDPYTESGEVFRTPDMPASRADTYNFGDTLSDMQEAFSLNYIENALTFNPALVPLATRGMADVYRFIAKAEGKLFSGNELAHDYSGAEINEISNILRRLMQVRDVVLKANQQHIVSAAQADQYRSELLFKLQGSYRNMNKMAGKISAVVNDVELLQLTADHYRGESQLLTTGAEENLLKFAELRGNQSLEQAERWAQAKRDFLRNKSMGGSGADIGGRLVAQLSDLVESVRGLAHELQPVQPVPQDELLAGLYQLGQGAPALNVEVMAPAQPGAQQVLESLAACLQDSFLPLIKVMDRKIDVDLCTHNRINEISSRLDELGWSLDGERSLENGQP